MSTRAAPPAAAAAEERLPAERPLLDLVRRFAPPLLGLALLAASLWVLHDLARAYHWREVTAALAALTPAAVLAAILLTALSYAALCGYEIVALRFTGKVVPGSRAALAALVAQGLAHSTGFAVLVGTGVRLRLYAAHGLGLADVATIQAVFSATFTLGVALLAGTSLALDPWLALPTGLPLEAVRGIGIVLLLAVAAWFAWSVLATRPLRLLGRDVRPPPIPLVGAQMACAVVDLAAAAGALWVLLPAGLDTSYPALLGIFTAAVVLGVVSHVPGGLGVIEGTVVLLLQPGPEHVPGVLGALLAFRAIYYLGPFLLAAATLALAEAGRAGGAALPSLRAATAWAEPALPTLLAGAALLAGAILMFSGATAAVPERIAVLPLALVETAHVANGLVGTALLLVAHGLFRRLDGAWIAACLLLAAGIGTSLLKGVDWEEALLLAAVLAIFLPCRRSFYRRTPLLAQPLSPAWIAAVTAIVLASLWLLLFAYRHVPYAHALWFQFAIEDDAPRSLRAAVGSAALLVLAALWSLVRPAAPVRPPGDPADLERARAIVAAHGSGSAWLALTGDKSFLFDETGRAFVMYAVFGRSWVAMGEPVGPVEAWPALLWAFRDLVDRAGGRCVFYEVGPDHLPLFLDLGLQPTKLGEAARVDLLLFTTAGRARQDLRSAQNRAAKAGSRFEVLPAEAVPAVLDELEAVSNAWLRAHAAREKRFSLGFFERGYLSACPCAVVRDAQGRILAFANLWLPADRGTAGLDLMRFLPGAPHGTMDFLLVEALLWAKARGYRWFDLGMAPLSGLPDHRLAPLWARLGRLAVRHGAQFYNFAGLRKFKEKFDPVWTPAYILCPPWSLPRALADTAALIAGGWRGIVTR